MSQYLFLLIICQNKKNKTALLSNCKSSELHLLATWGRHCADFPYFVIKCIKIRQLALIEEFIKEDMTRDRYTNTKCRPEYTDTWYTAVNMLYGKMRVAQDVRLTCLSVFDLSIVAQTLAMWPLTRSAVWGTCQRSEVTWVSWTQRHTLSRSLSFSLLLSFFFLNSNALPRLH